MLAGVWGGCAGLDEGETMVTIVTTYHGATNTRGARIVAKRADWKAGYPKGTRISVSYEHGEPCPHLYAARKLATDLEWTGVWAGGDTPTGKVFVGLPYGTTMPEDVLTDGKTAFRVERKER